MKLVVLDEELPLEKIQFLRKKYRVVSSPYDEELVSDVDENLRFTNPSFSFYLCCQAKSRFYLWCHIDYWHPSSLSYSINYELIVHSCFSSLHFLIKSTEHSDFSDKERSTLSKFVKVGTVL